MTKLIFFIVLLLTFYGCSMSQEKLEKDASCYTIVLAEPFGKKEFDKVYVPKFQLLDICPKRDPHLAYQEAKIKIRRDGKEIEVSFTPVKTFANKAEAKEFADKYGIDDQSMLLNDLPKCKLIRVIDMPLRKKSDKKTTPTICLLDVCLPPEANDYQHPVITFMENGKGVSRIYEVIKTFADKSEAQNYAKENGIIDVDFRNDSELGKIDAELTQGFHSTMRGEVDFEYIDKFKNLLKEKLKNPIIFENNLINLSHEISIQASPDKRLKFYSWDTMTGGTAHIMAVFAQFRADNGKIVVQEIERGASDNPTETDFIIKKIYEIKIKNQTNYLTFGWGTHGGGHQFEIVKVFRLKASGLIEDSAILPDKQDLIIVYPRAEKSDLSFDPATNEISYRQFAEDLQTGFMKATGKIIKLIFFDEKYHKKVEN